MDLVIIVKTSMNDSVTDVSANQRWDALNTLCSRAEFDDFEI